jgi:3-hydroxymyristoyl/3-hydroxydecanoyl-(acyl carrier protein) dehydratases
MLVPNLYRILNQHVEAEVIRAELEVDAAHEIFKGHFPSVPVLPGVCMVQCVKELIESSIEKKTRLDKADMIKFLSMLNPLESNVVAAEIVIKETTATRIVFQASLKSNNHFLLKYSGSLFILN